MMNNENNKTASAKAPETNWSTEQLAIFQYFHEGIGNRVIEARAGTGKTTTIKEAFSYAPEDRILYAVFNKRNQKEAEEKIKDNRVEVRTLHSLGFKFIKSVWRNAQAKDEVEWDRCEQAAPQCKSGQDMQQVVGCIFRAMAFAKNTTISPSVEDILRIMDEQDILCAVSYIDASAIAGSTLKAMELSKVKDAQNRISFNDMVWLPVAMNWVKPTYDLVAIDECQDMNLPQLVMARSACKPSGRIVVVGDPRQAIYGFRGAVQNGMSMMKSQLHAEVLPLTTTYRCPRKVVDMAREIVPDYNSAPQAIDGEIADISGQGMLKEAKVGDCILSRLNAPLMIHAMRLLRQGTPARIEGRDIGAQLCSLVKNFKAKSMQQLNEKIATWENREIDRLAKKKNAERKIEAIHDQALTLNTLCEGCESIDAVLRKISSLFEDSDKTTKAAVVLSSVHKAKGLEWNRTFLLTQTFNHRTPEESNIYYVALTRCKTHLFLVDSNAEPVQPPTKSQPPVKNSPGAVLERKDSTPESVHIDRSATFCRTVVDNFDLPVGSVRRKVGDVFLGLSPINQKQTPLEYIVIRVGDCNAKLVCLTRRVVKGKKKTTGEEFEFTAPQEEEVTWSNSCQPSDIIRHMDNFNFQSVKSARAERKKQTQGAEGNMKTKTEYVSLKGRSQYIRKLKGDGVEWDAAWKKITAKFPGSSIGNCQKVWNSKGKGRGASTTTKPVKSTASKKATKKTATPKPSTPPPPVKTTPPPPTSAQS